MKERENFNISASTFYDSLSEDYHLIYKDWDESITKQSKVLDFLIEKHSRNKVKTILDCTCGIGTQAIGLSQIGYEVTGTDISEKSIERAIEEAGKRNLAMKFGVCNLLELDTKIKGAFDAVLSCDNSLPHLINRDELIKSLKNILSKLKEGGLFIGSIRDYDKSLRDKKKSTEIIKRSKDGYETITFQLWDWNLDNTYTVNHFRLLGINGKYETILRKVKYKAYTRSELSSIFQIAGFKDVKWLMPDETNYFQPIIIGTN